VGDNVLLGDKNGHLRLVSLADGKSIWDKKVGKSVPDAPVVYQGLAIDAAEGALVALDLKDGSERWRIDGRKSAKPIIAHDLLFVGGKTISILKPDKGSVVHEFKNLGIRSGTKGRCSFDNGYLYVGSAATAINMRNGVKGLGTTVTISQSWPVIFNHDRLVLNGWSSTLLRYKPDADHNSRGKRGWSYKFAKDTHYEWHGSCGVNDKTVFLGNATGLFVALSVEKGKLQWKQQTDGEHHSSPMITADTVYAGTTNGWCYAMDINTGNIRWKMKAPASINQRLGIGDGVVIAVDNNGGITVWEEATN